MEFRKVVDQRRALRSFAPVEVSDAVIKDLAAVAGLAPSCSNKQPWRFVFVRSPAMLERMVATLAPGNATWAKQASLNAAASSPKRSISCIHQGSATALSAAEKPPKCLIVSTSVTLDVK